MGNEIIDNIKDTVISQLSNLGPKLLYAIVTLVLGLIISKTYIQVTKTYFKTLFYGAFFKNLHRIF